MPLDSPAISTRLAAPELQLRRFSPDEYRRLIRAGILSKDAPVELRDGLLVIKGQAPAGSYVAVLAEPNGDTRSGTVLPIHKFTVAEYHQMIPAGILQEGEPVELLEGWLVRKMTRNPPHDLALCLADAEISRRLPANWFRRGQSAVTTRASEPEPDLAVVRGKPRRYRNRHPGPRDMGLAVEISDTSLKRDRTFKSRVYARYRIPVYWIVNIPDEQVEVYTDPSGPGRNPRYRQRQDYGLTEAVPLVLDGQEIDRIPVRDLLP